jgi:hypothetical protein
MNQFWDRLGISASILCILHCLLTPALVVGMPFVGHWMAHGWFHLAIVLVVVPVAVWALWNGYRLHHKKNVLWLGGLGIALVIGAVTIGRSGFWLEVSMMTSAGVLLGTAHWINLSVCQRTH